MLSYAALVIPRRRSYPPWTLAAALLICAYAALLRLDAFAGKYGQLDHPAWARVATHDIAPLARHLRPASVIWGREPRPYVGGDPITYLQYAREMTTFYQPHVREPVFLALARFGLWSVNDQDAGISVASAIGSVLAVFAAFLLGAALVSPPAGLVAAALMAIEYESITWAVDGWRDDTFTAMFLLAAWAFVRFHQRASFGNAVLVGLTAGLACLTRITALSFVLPALVWVAFARGPERRERAIQAGVALAILTAVVTPYLISCAIASGDPLLAINYHTGYYRFAEGLPNAQPMSAADYVRLKFARHPIATLDVGATGLLVRPFVTKWNGFGVWFGAATDVLWWSALLGLVLWPFSPRGRLALVILLASLLPYAFTWNLGGGGEWRFTMHVYALYIVAAAYAWSALASGWWRSAIRPLVRRAAVVAAVGTAATATYVALPWFVAREAIAAGEAVNIEAGPRDRPFYRAGWSAPHTDGAVTVRVSQEPRSEVHFPLPRKRAYEIVLRFDPVAPDEQQRVTVLFNRQLLGTLRVSWNPDRVGSYRVSLPVDWVRVGANEIALVPDAMVPAAGAGPRFAWLDPAAKLGVRMWYLRVLD